MAVFESDSADCFQGKDIVTLRIAMRRKACKQDGWYARRALPFEFVKVPSSAWMTLSPKIMKDQSEGNNLSV